MSKSFPNGVNVEQLVGTINAIKNNPSIADFKSIVMYQIYIVI